MIKLIAFLCVALATITICGVASFKIQKDRMLSFLSLRISAILMIAIFAVVSINLSSYINGYSTFILLALIFQSINMILISLPTKDNIFSSIINVISALSNCMLVLSGFFIIAPSPWGVSIGFGVGIVVSSIIALARKEFNWKKDLLKYLSLAFVIALFGQSIVIILTSLSLNCIFFSVGALLYTIYSIMNVFYTKEDIKLEKFRNILYFLSLILISSSIFLIIY